MGGAASEPQVPSQEPGTRPPQGIHDEDLELPSDGRVRLEVENALLYGQWRQYEPGVGDNPQISSPSHLGQLQRIEQENESLSSDIRDVRRTMESIRAAVGQATPSTTASSSGLGSLHGDTDRGRSLQVMQAELALCQERQEKIHQMFRGRASGLQGQLQRAKQQLDQVVSSRPQGHTSTASAQLASEAQGMQEKVEQASLARDDLLKQLRILHAEAGGASGEVAKAEEEKEQWRVQVEQLKQELANAQGAQDAMEAKNEQQLQETLEQLREQLEMLEIMRRDERVRNDDEARELKKQRDANMDRLGELRAELQVIQAQADAYRSMQADGSSQHASAPPSTAELQALRAEYESKALELASLKQQEQERYQTIMNIEEEQIALVRTAGLLASKAVPEPP